MCDSSRSARGFRVPSNRNNPHPAPGWRWRAAQWAAVALPAALHSEKIRPRARPPAPAYGVRCPPRPAMQSIANGSAKFSVRSLTAFFLPQPPRRGGRPTPPPRSEPQRSLRSLALPLASAFPSSQQLRSKIARASRPPSAGSATRTARGYTRRAAAPENYSAPQSLAARLGEILPFQLIVETGYFPFKAWRAVV